MRRRIIAAISAAGLAIAGAGVIGNATASAATFDLNAPLAGAEEIPANGSTYTGTSTFVIDDVANQVCATWDIDNPDTDPVTATHIHTGALGVSGPPLIITGITSGDCAPASEANIDLILANPAGFYFNVHTQNFPGGGARGQLGLTPPTTTQPPTTTAPSTTSTTAAPPPACNPNYSGHCIPGHFVAGDAVNCSNTPGTVYVVPVRVVVIGVDVFNLNSDPLSDNFGCDSNPLPTVAVVTQPAFAG